MRVKRTREIFIIHLDSESSSLIFVESASKNNKRTETPASIIRFTALPPPPPHPTTLILADDAETTTVSFLEYDDFDDAWFLFFKETMDLLLEEIRLLDSDDDDL